MTSWESGSVEFNGTPICQTRGTGLTGTMVSVVDSLDRLGSLPIRKPIEKND